MEDEKPPSEASIAKYIQDTFPGVEVATLADAWFFFHDPQGRLPPKKKMPFVTIVNSDVYDRASNLGRPGAFRLNLGVEKETYRRLFGDPPAFPTEGGVVQTGHDFTKGDEILPHPVYASASWICVVNPSAATFRRLQPLLAEAHALAASRYERLIEEA